MIIQNVVTRLRDIIDKEFPGQIRQAILFGSHVKGTATVDSDLDILLVVNGDCPWVLKRRLLSSCYPLSLEFDVVLDVKIYSFSELQDVNRQRSFIKNALKYGIAA
ncbi:MAG: nucleotidyltransferase domain-containing protein [Fibrobacteres bacterium]|nr:nucleotidyltransferase domain-containing protein [Fibrobacterota bacterium]